jgi:hypothetical protein
MHNFPKVGRGVMISPQRWGSHLDILFYECQDGKVFTATQLQFHAVEEGDPLPPTTQISHIMAQQLMDELYRAGVRPTEAADNAGELKGTKAHLEDMRRLVFDVPGAIAGPPMETRTVVLAELKKTDIVT